MQTIITGSSCCDAEVINAFNIGDIGRCAECHEYSTLVEMK